MSDKPDGDHLHRESPTIQQLRDAKADGNQVLGSLFERYECRIRHWIRRAGVGNEHDVDELEGEVHLRVLSELPATEFDTVGKFRKWVQQIARNIAIDHLRRGNRNPARRHLDSLATSGGSQPQIADDQPGTPTRLDHAELVMRRRQAIAELPGPSRELIRLREDRGMTFSAIAAAQNEKARALGITKEKTEDSVRVAYNRIIKKVGPPMEIE